MKKIYVKAISNYLANIRALAPEAQTALQNILLQYYNSTRYSCTCISYRCIKEKLIHAVFIPYLVKCLISIIFLCDVIKKNVPSTWFK